MWIVYLLTTIHVIVCLFLVIVVLLQSGKAADLAGAFGGMGSQTAFGPRGAATVLSKSTAIAAGLFMVTSITLSIMGTRTAGVGTGSKSVLERAQQPTAPKPNATVPLPLPGIPAGTPPAGAPGVPQPSVTLTDPQNGKSQTIPITIPPQTPANTLPPDGKKK
jgi:preprotein translocase subunit SecG